MILVRVHSHNWLSIFVMINQSFGPFNFVVSMENLNVKPSNDKTQPNLSPVLYHKSPNFPAAYYCELKASIEECGYLHQINSSLVKQAQYETQLLALSLLSSERKAVIVLPIPQGSHAFLPPRAFPSLDVEAQHCLNVLTPLPGSVIIVLIRSCWWRDGFYFCVLIELCFSSLP